MMPVASIAPPCRIADVKTPTRLLFDHVPMIDVRPGRSCERGKILLRRTCLPRSDYEWVSMLEKLAAPNEKSRHDSS
jgi:hypothetical protein